MGRRGQGVQAQIALQPLADGLANRTAGRPIHHLAVIVDSAVHHQVCFGLFACTMPNQVAGAGMVSPN
jgi:hypothetical protein